MIDLPTSVSCVNEWEGRLQPIGEEKNANHCTVEIWFVALGSVCHEGELRYAKDFALYIFDACLPHVPGGI